MGVLPDSASRRKLRDDDAVRGEPPRPTRRLGEVLIDFGVLTPEQLDLALAAQRSRGGRLGEVLLDLGMIGPVDLVRTVMVQEAPGTDQGALPLRERASYCHRA